MARFSILIKRISKRWSQFLVHRSCWKTSFRFLTKLSNKVKTAFIFYCFLLKLLWLILQVRYLFKILSLLDKFIELGSLGYRWCLFLEKTTRILLNHKLWFLFLNHFSGSIFLRFSLISSWVGQTLRMESKHWIRIGWIFPFSQTKPAKIYPLLFLRKLSRRL